MGEDQAIIFPVRQLTGAPVIVQPYRSELWHTTKRLERCEIWSLPEEIPFPDVCCWEWWLGLFGRDVTLWPVDVWSSHVFTLMMTMAMTAWTERQRQIFEALRLAWGHPFAEEIGMPPAEIETLWRRAAR